MYANFITYTVLAHKYKNQKEHSIPYPGFKRTIHLHCHEKTMYSLPPIHLHTICNSIFFCLHLFLCFHWCCDVHGFMLSRILISSDFLPVSLPLLFPLKQSSLCPPHELGQKPSLINFTSFCLEKKDNSLWNSKHVFGILMQNFMVALICQITWNTWMNENQWNFNSRIWFRTKSQKLYNYFVSSLRLGERGSSAIWQALGRSRSLELRLL